MAASSALTPRTGSAAVPSPKLTHDVHIRLPREHVEELNRIAEEECISLSAIVRRFVVVELRRRQSYPPPLPLPRAHARDGNVQAG